MKTKSIIRSHSIMVQFDREMFEKYFVTIISGPYHLWYMFWRSWFLASHRKFWILFNFVRTAPKALLHTLSNYLSIDVSCSLRFFSSKHWELFLSTSRPLYFFSKHFLFVFLFPRFDLSVLYLAHRTVSRYPTYNNVEFSAPERTLVAFCLQLKNCNFLVVIRYKF